MVLLQSYLVKPRTARDASRLCSQCLLRISRPHGPSAIRSFVSSARSRSGIAGGQSVPSALHRAYFSENQTLKNLTSKDGPLSSSSVANCSSNGNPATFPSSVSKASPHETIASSTSAIDTESVQQELPHRRRKRLKEEASINGAAEPVIPPDASTQLSNFSSALPVTSIRRKLAAFLALTKPRLSFLIVLTTTSAYGLYPISTLLSLDPSMTPLPTLSTSTLTLIYLSAGTFISSASANTINMLSEPKYDAQMSRTRNRPLVRGLISRRAAVLFAIATAVSGLTLLYVGTNPTVTGLSASNIFLYGFVYTPLKRMHVINTWVGAIVGGIPPLMGWAGAQGQVATTGHDNWHDLLFSEDSIGGWLLAGILYAWQFPHFNALSHAIRDEYKAAGYKMLCWTNPARNARVALRYSILMFPVSIGLWWIGVVGHGFLVSSTLANGWLVKEAYRFWKYQGAKGTARGLFWGSVWQLPILLFGALVTKKGLWDGVWENIFGQQHEKDEHDYMYDDDEGEEEGDHQAFADVQRRNVSIESKEAVPSSPSKSAVA